MLPLVVGSGVPHSLHDLSKIEETNKTFFLFSHLMTSPRDQKDLDLLLVDAQLRCAHEDQLCLGAQGPYRAAFTDPTLSSQSLLTLLIPPQRGEAILGACV